MYGNFLSLVSLVTKLVMTKESETLLIIYLDLIYFL